MNHNDRFKCIVAGGRDFADYEHLKATLNLILCRKTNLEIVSGGANGADKLGERWAKENGHGIKIFPADWKMFGRFAGPFRNEEMAKYADGCIVFWDGKSRGTKSMIKFAKQYKLKLHIESYIDLPNSEQSAQECDATGDASSN
jgi:hypothetical protein